MKASDLENFIDQKREHKQNHPLQYLFWEATLRCNLSCLHCGSDCVRNNSTRDSEIPTTYIKSELKAIADRYRAESITFAIIGGEPLIRPDIIEVGAYAADLGYNWGITTNAMLLDSRTLQELKQARLTTISISLDGLATQHDQLRNHHGSYEIVTEAIRNLVTDRFYYKFDVICCVSKINIDHLEPFIAELIRLNVPAIRFVPIFSHGRASDHPELSLDGTDYTKLLHLIADRRKSQSAIQISLGEEGYWGPDWECIVRDRFHYCGSGILIGSILHNGDVTGCPSVSRNFIEGNITKDSFLDIWDSKFQRFRFGKDDLFPDQCNDCDHWELCEGGGFHLLDQDNVNGSQCCLDKIGYERQY